MGYTTDFSGEVEVVPPLNDAERDYLTRFNHSRRMARDRGPYYAQPGDNFGQGGWSNERKTDPQTSDVTEYNGPPAGQPGLWCQWTPTEDGSAITWDGGEKFYDSAEWMVYLIDHFLKPGAVVQGLIASHDDHVTDEAFASFTFDHVLNGTIDAQGEESDDRWQLVVTDNRVAVASAVTTFSDPQYLS